MTGVEAGLKTVIETNVLYCVMKLNIHQEACRHCTHSVMNGMFVHLYLPSEFLQLENITLTVIGQYNKSKPQLVKPYFFYYFLSFIYIFVFFVCVFFLIVSFSLLSFFILILFFFRFVLFYFFFVFVFFVFVLLLLFCVV